VLQLVSMPHVRGVATRLARRDRARDRGFLRDHPPGLRSLLVPTLVVEQVRTMVKSLELHRVHDGASGGVSHFARLATRAAALCGAISEQENQVALRAHRAANVAKHEVSRSKGLPSWSPAVAPGAKWADQDSTSTSENDAVCGELPVDPLVDCDPWACAAFASKVLPASAPSIDPWASWSPMSEPCLPPVVVADPSLAAVEKALLCIVDVATRVSGNLEACLESICGRLAAVSPPAALGGGDIADAPSSTFAEVNFDGSGVVRQLEVRLAKLEMQCDAVCHRGEGDVILKGFEVALRSEIDGLVERTTSCTCALLKKYDEGIQVLFADLRLSLASPPVVVDDASSLASVSTVAASPPFPLVQELSATGKAQAKEVGEEEEWSWNQRGLCADELATPAPVRHAFLDESAVVQYARLDGLRSTQLNGLPGVVVGPGTKPGCWQVFLHNDPVSKSVPGHNLLKYRPSADDICSRCRDQYRVDTVPKCGCGFVEAPCMASGAECSFPFADAACDTEDGLADALGNMSFEEWSSVCAVQNPFEVRDGDAFDVDDVSSTPTAGDALTTTTMTDAAMLAGSARIEARPGASGEPGLTVFR